MIEKIKTHIRFDFILQDALNAILIDCHEKFYREFYCAERILARIEESISNPTFGFTVVEIGEPDIPLFNIIYGAEFSTVGNFNQDDQDFLYKKTQDWLNSGKTSDTAHSMLKWVEDFIERKFTESGDDDE